MRSYQDPSQADRHEDVVEGVDLDRLIHWMDDRNLGTGPITDPSLITGGTQNIILRFRRTDRVFVLRRPPIHKRSNSDETMRREARVLGVLASTTVPHPKLIAACPDVDVIGATFYLMEAVDGFGPMVNLPDLYRSHPDRARALGLSLADAIVTVGSVDYAQVGLADFGRAEGWLERQVDRWRAHLDSYKAIEGYAGCVIPGVDEVARWLALHQPISWQPGLIHGDFHFGNVIIDPGDAKVAAIVDWELSTIGDPLLDLGHLLTTWPGQAGAPTTVMVDLPGLPDRDAMIARYAARSPRDLSAITWYQVLACYRFAIVIEGTHARACAGQAPRQTGDRLHAKASALFEQALDLIGAG